MQRDDAFLTLLSSQRELLNQLHMEMRKAEHPGAKSYKRSAQTKSSWFGNNNSLAYGGVESMLMNSNHSISRRASLDLLRTCARRLSLGMGASDHLSSFGFDCGLYSDEEGVDYDDEDEFASRDRRTDRTSDQRPRPKRRLSIVSLVSPTFFEDNYKASRRDSLLSLSRRSESQDECDIVLDNERRGPSSVDKEDVDDDDVSLEPVKFNSGTIDVSKVKVLFEAFTDSMERSQKSQQDIHDWDRKMGLKRSHSKTMRQSSRSRKKLRSVLRKEINSLTAMT